MNDIVLRVAAKGVVMNEEGKVLILREARYNDGTNEGKWGLPGGRLDIGESYLDGLKRELKEETGLDVVPGAPVYIGEWRPNIQGKQHQIIAIFTQCSYSGGDILLSEEHEAFAWVSLSDIEKYQFMAPDDDVLRVCLA